METRICIGCGKPMSDFNSPKAKYCTKACREKYARKNKLYYHKTLTCPACGKVFDSYKYRQTCSKKCAYKWREAKKRLIPIE